MIKYFSMDRSVNTKRSKNYAVQCLKAKELSCVKYLRVGFANARLFVSLFRITPTYLNTALWGRRSWNCELEGRCVLFLVHAGDSACFEFLAVNKLFLFPPQYKKNEVIMRSCVKQRKLCGAYLYLSPWVLYHFQRESGFARLGNEASCMVQEL